MDTKLILEQHKEMKLPSFPNNDEFAEWVEDLIELDEYYYGLVLSILGGEHLSINYLFFEDLRQRLLAFKAIEEDSDIYTECELYLNSLEKLLKLVQVKK